MDFNPSGEKGGTGNGINATGGDQAQAQNDFIPQTEEIRIFVA